MIDKITPHPDERHCRKAGSGRAGKRAPVCYGKGTVAAIYVNSENVHYLLIEDAFPNGHPPLEQCGVILTRRDIVENLL